MAYTLNKSSGATLILLNDGVVDTSVSSLNLIGKNVSSFGDAQNENFLFLLENFAKNIEPRSPLQGQIWFDSSSNVFRPAVFDGANWRGLAVLQYSNTTTDTVVNATGANFVASQPGDLWFNSATKQLYVITSTATDTVLIGPERVPGFDTTKLASVKVKDSANADHAIIEVVLDGEIVGVLSKDTFILSVTTPIDGFSKVYRGITFKNYSSSTRYSTTSTDVVLHGLHEQLDESYPRRNINEHIQGNWAFDNNVNLYFGTSQQSSIGWNSTSSKLNISANGTVNIGSTGNEVTFGSTEITPATNGILSLGNASSKFNNLYINNITTGGAPNIGSITGLWNLTAGSVIRPETDLSNNLGTSLLRFNNVYTKTLTATTVTGTALYDDGHRVVTSVQGTANAITVVHTGTSATISLPDTVEVTTLNGASIFDSNARVLTTATVIGTNNQISVDQNSDSVTISLPTTVDIQNLQVANTVFAGGFNGPGAGLTGTAASLTAGMALNGGVTSINGRTGAITTPTIIFDGQISYNSVTTFTIDPSKPTIFFVNEGNGAGGRQGLYLGVQWGPGSLSHNYQFFNSGVDYQVTFAGALLQSLPAGNGSSLLIQPYGNNIGGYGAPSSAKCLVMQF